MSLLIPANSSREITICLSVKGEYPFQFFKSESLIL